MASAPVITIDGPTASGKGTVAQRVAGELGFHYLDSGALYRLVALAAHDAGIALDRAGPLAQLAGALQPRFRDGRIELNGRDVTEAIRTEQVSRGASQIAVHAPVRVALLDLQKSFRQLPGLVADGRDMGTVVFPDARLKVFLTAAVEERAQRRYKQLSEKGISANLTDLLADLKARDARDIERVAAPLRAAADAVPLDSSRRLVDEVVAEIVGLYRKR